MLSNANLCGLELDGNWCQKKALASNCLTSLKAELGYTCCLSDTYNGFITHCTEGNYILTSLRVSFNGRPLNEKAHSFTRIVMGIKETWMYLSTASRPLVD